MKAIRIKQVTKINKKYIVNLGNGTSNSFTNKREAESYLYSTNVFLTEKLHELHQLYLEVFNSFEDVWFFLGNDRDKPKFPLKHIERTCDNNLKSIKELLNLSVDRCGFTNGNYFVMVHFSAIINSLENTTRLIAEVYGNHSNTNAIFKMDSIIKRLLYISHELNSYGKRSTTKIFKVPIHISEAKGYNLDYEIEKTNVA